MQPSTGTFHGYYIIPCYSEKCCTNSQGFDERTQQSRKSFSIEAILARPSHAGTSPKGERLAASRQFAHVLPDRMRTHPYLSDIDRLRQARTAMTYRAIVADSGSPIPRQQRTFKDEKPKRIRTVFTPEQLDRLEKEFDQQQYMVGTERFYLASELGLTETQVKVWFQNRRIKWRRQNLDTPHKNENSATDEGL